jgi:transposase InsO family protein
MNLTAALEVLAAAVIHVMPNATDRVGEQVVRGHDPEGASLPIAKSLMPRGGMFVAGSPSVYARGVTLDFSRSRKLTDNAFIEAFNRRFRSEWLNTHWFLTLADATEMMEALRC